MSDIPALKNGRQIIVALITLIGAITTHFPSYSFEQKKLLQSKVEEFGFQKPQNTLYIEMGTTSPQRMCLFSYARGRTVTANLLRVVAKLRPPPKFIMSSFGAPGYLGPPDELLTCDLGNFWIQMSVGLDYLNEDGTPWVPTQ